MKLVIDPDVLTKACQDSFPEYRVFLEDMLRMVDSRRSKVKPEVFLSYARPDQKKVEEIFKKLKKDGFSPWMDVKVLLPGEPWEKKIEDEIKVADFFLAFLSKHTTGRRGVLPKEHKLALKAHEGKLPNDIFIVPVLLEDCEVPDYLNGFHWLRWFERNSYQILKKTIQTETERRIRPNTPPQVADEFQIYLDKEDKIRRAYEDKLIGSTFYRYWFQHLTQNKVFDSDYKADFDIACPAAPCESDRPDSIQEVCAKVASASSSDFVYEGSDTKACHLCQGQSTCVWPQHLQTLGIPVFSVKAARRRMANLKF